MIGHETVQRSAALHGPRSIDTFCRRRRRALSLSLSLSPLSLSLSHTHTHTVSLSLSLSLSLTPSFLPSSPTLFLPDPSLFLPDGKDAVVAQPLRPSGPPLFAGLSVLSVTPPACLPGWQSVSQSVCVCLSTPSITGGRRVPDHPPTGNRTRPPWSGFRETPRKRGFESRSRRPAG